MVLRALRLRSVGPPIAVAAMSVAALVWFDKVWIPAQQQYLNERNLRSLKTVAAQIKAKVDNFELAIDHAIDSFPGLPGTNDLQKYVKLFSPELEVVDAARPAAKTVTLAIRQMSGSSAKRGGTISISVPAMWRSGGSGRERRGWLSWPHEATSSGLPRLT